MIMRRIYFRLRDIYTADLLLPMSTMMNFGPEDPALERKRKEVRQWMVDNKIGPGPVERLEVPYGTDSK